MSFGQLKTSGGNFVSRLGGFGDDPSELLTQQQIQGLTPDQLATYNQQRSQAQQAGMRELAARLSDAFAGRDIVGRAQERRQAKEAAEIKDIQKQKILRQQELDKFKKEIDLPQNLSIGGKTLLIGNRLANAGFLDEALPYFQMADKYKDSLSAADKFAFEKDLRKEYDNKTKDVKQVLDRARTTKKALLQQTGIGDIQAIFAFMQAADPGSRVTEGELRLTQGAGGALNTLLNMYNNYKEGDVFPQNTRDQIWSLVSEISSDQIKRLQSLDSNYKGLAEEYGVSSENIISPYDFDTAYITSPLSSTVGSSGDPSILDAKT